jgi:hypothetical protein
MKEKLISAGLFIGTMILCLLALEISLRAYHGEWEFSNLRFPQANKFVGYHTYDAELGWIPEQQQATVWGKTVTILEDGIRSNGGGEVRDGTEDAILAVGDSYTFGDQVADAETWPAQLDQLSGKRVVNGGVDGYGVDQIFLRAQRLLNRYRFSTLIFSFIPDDLRRSQMSVMFATAKPYFDFKGGQLTLENVPVPPPSFLPQKESPLLIAMEHSRLVDAVMKRVTPKWWLRGAAETQVQDQEQVIKVTCALLQKLEELAKSRGSELIVLAQHWEFEPASEATESERVLHCLSDPETRVLDLKPALSELKARDPARYHELYNPFLHMSAEGNQFVARELLPVLAER